MPTITDRTRPMRLMMRPHKKAAMTKVAAPAVIKVLIRTSAKPISRPMGGNDVKINDCPIPTAIRQLKSNQRGKRLLFLGELFADTLFADGWPTDETSEGAFGVAVFFVKIYPLFFGQCALGDLTNNPLKQPK